MALPILDGNQTATTLSTVLTSGEHIPAHTVVSLGSTAISNITSAVSGSVVSVSNLPSTQTIAGTVTANVQANFENPDGAAPPPHAVAIGFVEQNGDFKMVQEGSWPFPISGTVTANAFGANQAGALLRIPVAEAGDAQAETGVPIAANIGGGPQVVGDSYPLPISGTVTANLSGTKSSDESGTQLPTLPVQLVNLSEEIVGVPSNPLPISGTVTANNPNGALTTRFGSVATANLAFITSAVTNTSRKYLLAQNISAGTVTIGIGFSPTTTQGIQLSAGGGLTFDAFCPTGAVYWLGAVTGANYCLIEG